MPRTWRERVEDVANAAERIISMTADVDFDGFTSNPVLRDAVLYNFVIIGEAAIRVPPEIQRRHPAVPWRDIRAMRNFVAHVYHGVSDAVVWATIGKDLPLLRPALAKVLADETATDDG